MARSRPKPSWPDSKSRDANAPFLGWLDRLLGDLLGSYDTLREAIQAMIDAGGGGVSAHASTHIRSGSDEIDGDLVDIDYSPPSTGYTSTTDGTATSTEHLRAHLVGIAAALQGAKTTTYSGYGWNSNSTITLGGGPFYMSPIGVNVNSAITQINDRQMLWGRTGTLTNFRFKQLTSTGDADTMKISLAINGVDTALSFAGVAGNDTATKGPDTSQVPITAGDRLVLTIDADGAANATTADQTWSFDFVEP